MSPNMAHWMRRKVVCEAVQMGVNALLQCRCHGCVGNIVNRQYVRLTSKAVPSSSLRGVQPMRCPQIIAFAKHSEGGGSSKCCPSTKRVRSLARGPNIQNGTHISTSHQPAACCHHCYHTTFPRPFDQELRLPFTTNI